MLERCIEIALQAPSGSNRQGWHFVVVTDEISTLVNQHEAQEERDKTLMHTAAWHIMQERN